MKVKITARLIHKGKIKEIQNLGNMIALGEKISNRYFKKLKKKCTLKSYNNACIKFYANDFEIKEIPLYDYCILTKEVIKNAINR